MVAMDWFKLITEIQALAQSGLAYTVNEFDKGRYQRLMQISAAMAAHCTSESVATLENLFSIETGYATPKLDLRSFTLKENKILLVRERIDGLWSLPGGWGDINESPAEAVIRETREESGYEVKVLRLLALWDKHKHQHPQQWPHVYKCFFHCHIEGGEAIEENLEITAVDFFALEKLPPLSLPRVTPQQLQRLYKTAVAQYPTEFD